MPGGFKAEFCKYSDSSGKEQGMDNKIAGRNAKVGRKYNAYNWLNVCVERIEKADRVKRRDRVCKLSGYLLNKWEKTIKFVQV